MITPRHSFDLDAGDDVAAFIERSSVPDDAVRKEAYAIVQDVRLGGETALISGGEGFGGALVDGALNSATDVLSQSWKDAAPELRAAIEAASSSIPE